MLADWSDFFVASAGASAALAGLIIVAISVSVSEMIAIPGMTARAGTSIALLVLVAVVSLAALIPHQPVEVFGLEVLALGAVCVGFAVHTFVRLAPANSLGRTLAKGTPLAVPPVLVVVGGIAVAAGAEAGLALVAAGAVLAIVAAVVDAWVVLVEIRR